MHILHSTSDWLSLTKSWIYDQIRFMPTEVKQTVWCDQLIEGPHTAWNGRVWLHQPTVFEKIANRLCGYCRQRPAIYARMNSFTQYDIIFSHFGYRAWRDYQFVKDTPIKKVVRFYGCDVGVTPKQPGWMEKYKILFDAYDLFICEGPYMAKELEKLGAPKEKIKWLHIGIDPMLISDELTDVRSLIDPLCILIAGTFTEKKGIEYALEGILQFVREKQQKVKLTIVGDANPAAPDQVATKYRINQIMDLLRKEGSVEVVQTGYIPLSRLISLMKENLILISPSVTAKDGDIEGGFPVTLTHAAVQGMILIGTDHCDLPEIVRDGLNGFVCGQKSSDDICAALKRIRDFDLFHLNEMRKKSQTIVKSEFNQVHICSKLFNLFMAVSK
jgi:colanic acid/amylovoran biosynthesis glycosyltransferase